VGTSFLTGRCSTELHDNFAAQLDRRADQPGQQSISPTKELLTLADSYCAFQDATAPVSRRATPNPRNVRTYSKADANTRFVPKAYFSPKKKKKKKKKKKRFWFVQFMGAGTGKGSGGISFMRPWGLGPLTRGRTNIGRGQKGPGGGGSKGAIFGK